MAVCLVIGCGREARHLGYCGAHYQRLLSKGDPGVAEIRDRVWKIPKDAVCSVEGCSTKVEKKGLCSAHYQRNRAYGSPTGKPESRKQTVGQVLDRYVKKGTRDECWEWQAGVNHHGYGTHQAFNGQQLAHRSAYSLWIGSIPDGLCVLHRCDNRKCCNPSHLFLGDNNDNTQDMIRKGRSRRSLCVEDVCLIRDKNHSVASLIEKFGLSRSMIGLIRARKSYRDIN